MSQPVQNDLLQPANRRMNPVEWRRSRCMSRLCTGLMSVAMLVVLGCRPNHEKADVPVREKGAKRIQVSLKQVYGLGSRPTYGDVYHLVKGADQTQQEFMLSCPAEEGGIYFFLFGPTHELPGELPKEVSGDAELRLPLIAVLQGDSYATDNLTYVWPKRLSGKHCAGYGGKSSTLKAKPQGTKGDQSNHRE